MKKLIYLIAVVIGLAMAAAVQLAQAQLPVTPTPVIPTQGNATGSTAAVVGTLTALTGRTVWICGFSVGSLGGTAATGPITIAGLNGGSQVWQLTSSATGTTVGTTFTPCIPASAASTNITITTTANGTASAVDVNSWGYNQ